MSEKRLYTLHVMDTNANIDRKEKDFRVTAEIVVPGLGRVGIDNCLSNETIEILEKEVMFALEQKMQGKGVA